MQSLATGMPEVTVQNQDLFSTLKKKHGECSQFAFTGGNFMVLLFAFV
jgi:hypothetical protein